MDNSKVCSNMDCSSECRANSDLKTVLDTMAVEDEDKVVFLEGSAPPYSFPNPDIPTRSSLAESE